MKKIAIFLILCLILILMISCGNSTSNTSCETTNTASKPTPSISTTQPSSEPSSSVSTTLPTTTKAPITSTNTPTETLPTSTSQSAETDPDIIRAGFGVGKVIACPLEIAYEMPKSCSLSDETVSVTLYFGLHDSVLISEYVTAGDYFDIYLGQGTDVWYRHRNITAEEIEREEYFVTYENQSTLYSHSETVELPLSIFSENAGNLYWYSIYMRQGETPYGFLYLFLSYQKIDDETIVFSADHIYPFPPAE